MRIGRRPSGKLRYVAFDSQFEVTPCIPERNIILEGVNCHLLRYFVDWLPEGKRKTIAIYEESTERDEKLSKIDEQEQTLWDLWESSRDEQYLERVLSLVEKRCEILGVKMHYETTGRDSSGVKDYGEVSFPEPKREAYQLIHNGAVLVASDKANYEQVPILSEGGDRIGNRVTVTFEVD